MKHLRINKRKKKLIIGSVIALASLAAVIGYTMFSTESHTQEDKTNSTSTVSVKELLASNKENISYLTGKVVPNEISKINADSTKGIINEVFVKVGDQVKKGQKLFTYNNSDGQIDLDDADTNIAKCQNKINSLNESIASKTQELSKKQVELAEENNKINNTNKVEKETLRQDKKVLEETINAIQTEIQTSNSELNSRNVGNFKIRTDFTSYAIN
ncbi:biotin/lipoyl-binding protein [Enterococcus faecalis]|uniref:biotin/lipoyl-binding protein n=1 Tax=Enterococcus faecalis TaxID=1351 RepID=UPI003D6ABEDD